MKDESSESRLVEILASHRRPDRRVHRLEPACAARRAPLTIEGHVPGDAIKPRRKPALAFELWQPAMEEDEDILSDVVGVIGIAGERFRPAANRALDPLGEPGKRTAVSTLRARDQGRQVGPVFRLGAQTKGKHSSKMSPGRDRFT